MTTLDYSFPSSLGRFVASSLAIISKRQYALAILLVLITAIVSIRDPAFLSLNNARDIFVNAAQTAVISCGVMLVIVTGEIDISVGSQMGLLTAILGTLIASPADTVPGWGWPVPVGVLVTLLAGLVLGLINGLLVTLVRIPSIIVTLAMLMALGSLAKKIMHRGNIDVPDALHNTLGTGTFLAIPVPVWVMAGVVLFTAALIRYTPIGRRIYAVGSNAQAAALSGLSVDRIKVFTFALTGLLVGVATVISQLAKFTNSTGQGVELLVVTCIVVGGVSINGGTGSVLGVFLGVLLLTTQKTFLIYLNLGEDFPKWDKAIQGGLILAAVLIDHLAARRTRT